MPFKMKGSPLKAVGETRDGIIKRALTGQKANIETSSQRQSKGLYTKAELAAKSSNKDLSDKFTASLSKPGNKANNPFVNGVDTSVAKPTPKSTSSKTPAKNPPKNPEANSGNKKDYFASTAKALTAYSLKSDNNKGAKGAAVKEFAGTAEFLNAGKDVSFTPGYKPSSKPSKEKAKSTKSTDAPKSRKELRLAKTKKKAADVKSDYNAGSRGQAEGRAAKAKHNRLNKRAERIESRIAKKKNKK